MLEIKRSFFLVLGLGLTYGLLVRERIVAGLAISEFYPMVCHLPKQYQNLLVQICSHTQKMNSISKKNTVPTRKTAPQTKTLKRSKSTELLPTKKNSRKTRLERDQSEDTITNAHSLAKSKSAKSIKSKQHTQHKSQPSCKKPKGKKKLQSKTTKKQVKRQLNDSSSFLTEQFKTIKPTNEYFIYCNNYIPIENSAQRRLVYRIQMIDMEHKSTADSFNLTRVENKDVATDIRQQGRIQEDKEDRGVVTDARETKEIAVGEAILNSHEETQTERNSYQQSADKCFADVLTELEFLYMPNQQNFQPFTHEQRLHYGEMLQALAKKMLSGCKNVVIDQLTDDQITVLIYQREGIQVGALEYIPLEGFPTHLLAVLAYLKNLFCFINFSYKEEVIDNLKQFYGQNYNQRVNRLSRKLPHEKDRKNVLSPQIFKKFEEQMFKDYEFPNELVEQAVHIHNRAVFDAVNAELQVFRPFYASQGEPFPWSTNIAMTHYDITEEALYVIFMQIKEKIQKQIITLCGIHLDFDDNDLPSAHTSPFYVKKMEEKINKMAIEEFKTVDDSSAIDYEKTALRFEVQQQIFFELISELQDELMAILGQKHNDEQSDFQYFY